MLKFVGGFVFIDNFTKILLIAQLVVRAAVVTAIKYQFSVHFRNPAPLETVCTSSAGKTGAAPGRPIILCYRFSTKCVRRELFCDGRINCAWPYVEPAGKFSNKEPTTRREYFKYIRFI